MMILKTMMWTTMIQEAACKTRQVLARIDQESVLIFCDKTYWRKISGHLWVPQRGGERRRPRRDPCIWGETDKDPQVFRIPFASNHLNLWGLAWHHLQVTADILEAAEEGVKQLAGARGEHHHFNLQYVESAKIQVQMPVTGTVLKDRILRFNALVTRMIYVSCWWRWWLAPVVLRLSLYDKVVAGTNYLMTVIVSASNCTVDRPFDGEKCAVVNKDQR